MPSGLTVLELIEGSGTISLSERGEKDEHDYYGVIPLLESTNSSEITIRFAMEDNDFKSININISAIHEENPDTGRAFHAYLERTISWEELKLIYHYLGFLLDAVRPKT